jgi:hypothetical protein
MRFENGEFYTRCRLVIWAWVVGSHAFVTLAEVPPQASFASDGSYLPQCQGQAVSAYDLLEQFSGARNQREHLLCAQFAFAAALETTFYRSDKKHRSFDLFLIATLTGLFAHQPSERAAQTHRKGERSGMSFFETGHPLELLNAQKQARLLAPYGAFECDYDFLIRSELKLVKQIVNGEQPEIAFRPVLKDATLAVRHYVYAKYFKNPDEDQLESLSLTKIHEAEAYPHSTTKDESGYSIINPKCDVQSPGVRQLLQRIDAQLCLGVPVILTFYARGVEVTRDGGQTWDRQMRFQDDPAPELSMHMSSVQAAGWVDGEWTYYIFNSWDEGSKEVPHRSQIRLRRSDLCRVNEAWVLRGPWDFAVDRKPLVKVAPQPSSTVPGTNQAKKF